MSESYQNLSPVPWLKDWLERFKPSPYTALDLGCGTGRKAVRLAKAGFAVTGIDISEKAIDVAREESAGLTPEPRYLVANLQGLAGLGLSRDFGLILDSLASQFLPEPEQEKLFEQVAGLLHPDGYFMYVRLDVAGEAAPPWVRTLSIKPATLDQLLVGFSRIDKQQVLSGNLPDTQVTRLLLKPTSS